MPFDNAAALVFLTKGRTSGLDEPAALLHPSQGGDYHFADHRRTVVYTIHKRDLPSAFRARKKYFWWAATSCGGLSGDDAPNSGRKRQALKRHDHR